MAQEDVAPIRVGLLGAGTVGSQTARLLVEQKDELAARIGRPIELTGVACLDPVETDPFPWIDKAIVTTDTMSVATNSDIVIELIGGTGVARKFVLAAIESGASVVTANKALLAKYGPEIYAAAEAKGVDIYFEASVGGAIPFLKPLRESLVGDKVTSMLGIVNGTTNYILDEMTTKGLDFDDVLKDAQAKGYAEADPTGDIEGYDAANKAAIMATLGFHTSVTIDDVSVEGITKITADDIAAATAENKVIKLLAVVENTDAGVSARVYPALISNTHPLASVHGSFNAVFVKAEAADDLMFYGRGAGGAPTASAVVGDVVTDIENPVEMEPIEVEEPTLSVIFEASSSPLVGKEGDIVGGRQLKERLFNEAENNVTMKIEELEDKSGVEVSGRGILHLSVLMESMRREGFEFQVGRPRVLFKKDENGNKMEPVEQAVVECPDEYSGKVVEVFGTSGGIMTSMDTSGIVTHLEFKIPTRGIMGLKNRIMNVTHGEGVFYHTFLEYGPYAGEIGNRQNGAMISMTTEKAVAYALGTLQERGQLFVEPGTECYEGMIVGERSKAGDMVVNIARTKNLGNQRSSTSDISVQLVPPRTFSLEEALEYIADDELVEITPKNIRLRKRLLNATDRKKAAVRAGQVNK